MAKTDSKKKVLRIGVVQGGKIIEERLLRRRSSVTVGQSTRNDFVITSPEIPLAYTVISRKQGIFHLQFEKGMFGKVLSGGEVLDLKTVAQRKLAVRKENHFSLPLNYEMRGKIQIGDVSVLFQFVDPPPDVPKLQLPASAKGAWWRNVDKNFLTILFFSFVFQGGLEGYQEYYWRTTGRFLVKAEDSAPKILQTLVKMEKQQEEVVPEEEAADKKDAAKEVAKEKAPGEAADEKTELLESKEGEKEVMAEETEASGLEVGDPTLDEGGMDDMKDDIKGKFEQVDAAKGPARALSAEERLARADEMVSNRTVAGVLGSAFGTGDGGMDVLSGGAKTGADAGWGEGDITTGDGDFGGPKSELFDDSVGSLMGNEGAVAGGGVPNIAANLDIDVKANAGPTDANAISGPKKKLEVVKKDLNQTEEKKIQVRVRGGTITGMIGGKIDKAALEKYIRQRTVAVQRCYLDAVRRNPNAGGRLVLELTISTNGRAGVSVLSDDVGEPSVAKCVVAKMKGWKFPQPKDKAVQLKLPFVFRQI